MIFQESRMEVGYELRNRSKWIQGNWCPEKNTKGKNPTGVKQKPKAQKKLSLEDLHN